MKATDTVAPPAPTCTPWCTKEHPTNQAGWDFLEYLRGTLVGGDKTCRHSVDFVALLEDEHFEVNVDRYAGFSLQPQFDPLFVGVPRVRIANGLDLHKWATPEAAVAIAAALNAAARLARFYDRGEEVAVHFEDGAYWAELPCMPGCFASGDTEAELRENLAEAIRLYEANPSRP